MNTFQAVITADIVRSRSFAAELREQLYGELKKCLQSLKKEKWVQDYEFFQGDSVQLLVSDYHQSLRVALMIRSFFRSISADEQKQDIRLAVGIGTVDFYKPKHLAHSDGQAFYFSGDALVKMKNDGYNMSVTTPDKALNESLHATMLLLDAVVQRWSSNASEAIYYRLKNLKEEKIAALAGVTQPAINQRLKSGQWNAIEALLHYFETSMKL